MRHGGWGVTYLDHIGSKTILVADRVHVTFQVEVEELEDEVELGVGVNNVEQSGVSRGQAR